MRKGEQKKVKQMNIQEVKGRKECSANCKNPEGQTNRYNQMGIKKVSHKYFKN